MVGGDDPLTGTEQATIRKMLKDLSFNEIHLFWMGLYAGFVAARPKRKHEPTPELKEKLEWELNQWYWSTAYIIGYVLKVLVVGGVGVSLMDAGVLF